MRILKRTVLMGLALAALAITAWKIGSLQLDQKAAAVPADSAPKAVAGHWIRAEGRLQARPGAKVTVSSEVAGVLTNIMVSEKSSVRAGDLIAEIKADDIYASLMEARARVAEFEAEILLAKSELQRGQMLAETNAISRQELERLTEKLNTLRARHTTAEVTVRRLEITLAKTRITAPITGVVLMRYVHPGEVVAGGTPIITVVDLDRTWIEAEVDEYDTARLKLGAEVLIRAEGFTHSWRGRIEQIPDGVHPRALHPQDPAQPSDVRILLVKVELAQPTPLKLGQRVDVEIAGE